MPNSIAAVPAVAARNRRRPDLSLVNEAYIGDNFLSADGLGRRADYLGIDIATLQFCRRRIGAIPVIVVGPANFIWIVTGVAGIAGALGQEEIDKAVAYVLGRPNFFLNTAADIHLLPKVLDAAKRFETAINVEHGLEEMALEPLFV